MCWASLLMQIFDSVSALATDGDLLSPRSRRERERERPRTPTSRAQTRLFTLRNVMFAATQKQNTVYTGGWWKYFTGLKCWHVMRTPPNSDRCQPRRGGVVLAPPGEDRVCSSQRSHVYPLKDDQLWSCAAVAPVLRHWLWMDEWMSRHNNNEMRTLPPGA